MKSVKQRVVFRGKFITVRQWVQPLPDGRRELFEQAERPASVIVFPVDDRKRITLIREKRFGLRGWIWNAPSGKVEDGKSPLAAARQELREEAGLRAARWKRIGGEVHRSGVLAWKLDVFVAQDLRRVSRVVDPVEPTKPVALSLSRAYALATAGKLHYADVAFFLIRLWHERNRWLK